MILKKLTEGYKQGRIRGNMEILDYKMIGRDSDYVPNFDNNPPSDLLSKSMRSIGECHSISCILLNFSQDKKYQPDRKY